MASLWIELLLWNYWHWLVLGVVLGIGELVLPGMYLFLPGLAALVTGILA
ncbi:MAG: hypothetical protein HQL37_13305, partial [Alphaproteobacteria bacterium]|nr:hypothetical protein [Alphaproteobacteria bacterium]